ncbi:MAG: diaminobutyrate--2-oxoglutarate transaminase [Pirellulaceae bacterium]
MLEQISRRESNVRGYVRLFPTVFDRAVGSELWDTDGKRYIDFFCGAGTLNYGHNNPRAKEALLRYIENDGVQHGLDTATRAKAAFLRAFESLILKPRSMDYRVQFTGPTGTNAVEAALKVARLSTGRSHVVAFTNAYHGHTLGSLAVTGNSFYQSEQFGGRTNVSHFPFDGYAPGVDSADLLDRMLTDRSSGLPLPAAIILETVQGEGGVNVASMEWLKKIEQVCRKYDCLLIVDDIQVGNGRTGKFFSFEDSGIRPDIVCLSKSIGGGLPLSLVLIQPEVDVWKPGQHTGTFRGNNLAFVAAEALLPYWSDDELEIQTYCLSAYVEAKLDQIVRRHASLKFDRRGRGLIQGLDVREGSLARSVIQQCFENGLLIESSGNDDQVLKVMPALTCEPELIESGLAILTDAIDRVVERESAERVPAATAGVSGATGAAGQDRLLIAPVGEVDVLAVPLGFAAPKVGS